MISFDMVKGLLPEKVTLIYLDYRDNLDNYMKDLQNVITTGDLSHLYDALDPFISECTLEGVRYVRDELRKDLKKKYNLTIEEVDEIMNEYDDEIEEVIYDRDDSDIIRELIRRQRNPVFFYDTGVYIDELNPYDIGGKKEMIKKIKKALKIPVKNKDYDSNLKELLGNASYGGNLVVYFNYDLERMLEICEENKLNRIDFRDAHIAIINMNNGSGYDIILNSHDFTIPFSRENLFIDHENLHYSYTFQVCGMGNEWCGSTLVQFSKSKSKTTTLHSPISEELTLQRKYEETFKNGGCTTGDMDIRRHRDIYYINDFPCGNKCPHCGTFFID